MRGDGSPVNTPGPAPDVLILFLEAALADRNWPEAQRRAWQLYLTQLPDISPAPHTWTAARRRLREAGAKIELSPEARVGIARALCHYPQLEQEQDVARTAVDLCLANLHSRGISGPTGRRSYQASLLLLAYLLPRLSHFDDLQDLVHRLPGLREQVPGVHRGLELFHRPTWADRAASCNTSCSTWRTVRNSIGLAVPAISSSWPPWPRSWGTNAPRCDILTRP